MQPCAHACVPGPPRPPPPLRLALAGCPASRMRCAVVVFTTPPRCVAASYPGRTCATLLPGPAALQLSERLAAFLSSPAGGAAGDGASDSEAAELPLVEHAPGFERYKVSVGLGRHGTAGRRSAVQAERACKMRTHPARGPCRVRSPAPLVSTCPACGISGAGSWAAGQAHAGTRRRARRRAGPGAAPAADWGGQRAGQTAVPEKVDADAPPVAPTLPPNATPHNPPQTRQDVSTEAFAHEAGYDAYMTGAVSSRGCAVGWPAGCAVHWLLRSDARELCSRAAHPRRELVRHAARGVLCTSRARRSGSRLQGRAHQGRI